MTVCAMNSPTVTVWGGGQLVGATSLPQFNATTGAQTTSIQLTNNSDVTLIFALERTTPVTVLPRYRLTAPCQPNSQYSVSLAPNQTGSADTTQYVTLTESSDTTAFANEPLNNNVTVSGGTVTVTGIANVNVTNTPAVTLTGAGNNVNIANTPTVNANVANATISGGTIDIQNVTNGILTAAGNLEYLGHFSVGNMNLLTLSPLVRALVVIPDTSIVNSGFPIVLESVIVPTLFSINGTLNGAPVYVGYVNPALTWQVGINNGFPGTAGYQVFTDTAFPFTSIVKDGQQPMGNSIPVTIASNQTTLPVTSNGAPIGLSSARGANAGIASGVVSDIGSYTPPNGRIRSVIASAAIRGTSLGGAVSIADFSVYDGTNSFALASLVVPEGTTSETGIAWPQPIVPSLMSANVPWTIRCTNTSLLGTAQMDAACIIVYD